MPKGEIVVLVNRFVLLVSCENMTINCPNAEQYLLTTVEKPSSDDWLFSEFIGTAPYVKDIQ